jgi:hypothetical protein
MDRMQWWSGEGGAGGGEVKDGCRAEDMRDTPLTRPVMVRRHQCSALHSFSRLSATLQGLPIHNPVPLSLFHHPARAYLSPLRHPALSQPSITPPFLHQITTLPIHHPPLFHL